MIVTFDGVTVPRVVENPRFLPRKFNKECRKGCGKVQPFRVEQWGKLTCGENTVKIWKAPSSYPPFSEIRNWKNLDMAVFVDRRDELWVCLHIFPRR